MCNAKIMNWWSSVVQFLRTKLMNGGLGLGGPSVVPSPELGIDDVVSRGDKHRGAKSQLMLLCLVNVTYS